MYCSLNNVSFGQQCIAPATVYCSFSHALFAQLEIRLFCSGVCFQRASRRSMASWSLVCLGQTALERKPWSLGDEKCPYTYFGKLGHPAEPGWERLGTKKTCRLESVTTFPTRVRFSWFLHRLKAESLSFQTVQKSWKTNPCSESYGPFELDTFSMEKH